VDDVDSISFWINNCFNLDVLKTDLTTAMLFYILISLCTIYSCAILILLMCESRKERVSMKRMKRLALIWFAVVIPMWIATTHVKLF
jgi:uncharacterized membrane protein